MGKFDGIFDDVVVNAKAAASAVSKKASEMYDTSKHKITAAELRGEINKKLRDLGALAYKTKIHEVDLSEDIDKLVSEITELKENLYVINNHIASVKNQKKCPQCEADVPKNSIYCNICGAKLDDSKEAEETNCADSVVEEAAQAVDEAVDEVAEAAEEAVGQAEKAAEKAGETVQEVAGEAAEKIDEAVDSIGGLDAE